MSAVTLAEALADPLAVWLTAITWPSSVVSEWLHPFAPTSEVRASGANVWLPGGLGFGFGDEGLVIVIPDHAADALASVDWEAYDTYRFAEAKYAVGQSFFIFIGKKNGVKIRLWLPLCFDSAEFFEEKTPPEIMLGEAKLARWKRQ